MPKLIVLTGFMGNGKSHAAKQFDGLAYRIDGDHLFSTSHRTLRPQIPEKSPERNDWDAWPRDKRDPQTLQWVFATSLLRAEPGLASHRGNVIADGAIFVYDWFRVPMIEALGRLMPVEHLYLLYLNISEQLLLANIHRRGKRQQMEQYPTVEAVKRDNDGFKRKFGVRWEEFTSYETFEARIRAILTG